MDRKNESNLEGFAKILVNLELSSQAVQLFAMTVPTYSIYRARCQYIDLSESLLTSNFPGQSMNYLSLKDPTKP